MSDLTKEERAWLRKVQRVLDECPSKRLGFYTVGDPTIAVYDNTFDRAIDDISSVRGEFCTAVNECDAGFDLWLQFPSDVHSTAG